MKRFFIVTALFIGSVLVVWAFFQTSLPSTSKAQSNTIPNQVPTINDNTMPPVKSKVEAIPSIGMNVKVAPVFDATGAVLSDPTGTLLSENHPGAMIIPVTGAAVKVAPVFDTTGAVVSDPTGTLSNENHPGAMVIPVTGTVVKVAPVFDSTGAVVSDPTGTLLNAAKP